jgi:hypothetical protein
VVILGYSLLPLIFHRGSAGEFQDYPSDFYETWIVGDLFGFDDILIQIIFGTK